MKTAKIFMNGQSQAVRLPKEYRFNCDEVLVKKTASALILIPKTGSWDILLDSLNQFSDDFMQERSQPSEQLREDLF